MILDLTIPALILIGVIFAGMLGRAVYFSFRAGKQSKTSQWFRGRMPESVPEDESAPDRTSNETECILIVDDEEAIREIIYSMLTTVGYRCKQSSNGAEALAVLDSGEEFMLMLSNLMMPKMDGIALLEQVKVKFPDLPVVIVTAVHDISVALAAIRNGASDYLLKPFERDQLLAVVRRALEIRRLKLKNREYQTNLEALVTGRTEQLERAYDIMLEGFGDALDLKDAETAYHSKRVACFSIAIARAMGLPDKTIRVIGRGAFLHDLGIIAIPDAILRKPGPLTPDEVTIMREHCYLGYQMLRKIPFLSEASEIVYAHQEWWDGSGYPRGLTGDTIPLGARIVAVVEALDAITSDRPYGAARPFSVAREQIIRWSGRQFDPNIVKVFLAIPETIWSDLRKEIDSEIHSFAYRQKMKTGQP